MRSKRQIEQEFCGLSCELSPENLTCDGELTTAEVMAKYSRIRKRWKELEREYGRKVSEEEAFRF